MQCFEEHVRVTGRKSAVALGFFDGVHLGHRAVISKAAACSAEGLTPVVYTFKKSPRTCISGENICAITSIKDKAQIIKQLGIDYLYTVDFNKIRSLQPREFISEILCGVLSCARVFCGFNYRFGVNGSGDSNLLKAECGKHGIDVTVVPPVLLGKTVVSSTEIRRLLESGNIAGANKMLGYNFGYQGKIIPGRQLGRILGAPTINQKLEKETVIPKFGVYASFVSIENKLYTGVTNIGVKPTVGSSCILGETWLTDFSGGSLYGKNAKVELLEFLRPERKFASLEELKEAILSDGKKAAQAVAEHKTFAQK